VLALTTAGLLGACSGSDGGVQGGYVQGDGVVTLVAPDRRGEPVALSGSTFEGQQVDLAAMRGKPVVLNVWYATCPPCRKEAPELEAASKTLAAKGVRFLGLNTRDGDPAPVTAFQERFGVTYPSLRGGNQALLALRGAVAPNAVPTTVVLDAQGRVAGRISGGTTAGTVVGLVEDVLAGKAS
jgi:thiol-disulfide isomerase/thioredoxin